MIKLSNESVEQILHEETQKTEELTTILRAIYTRYMNLYEVYFADVEALNDDKIAKLKQYHEVTRSLVKYYYLDIPMDVILGLNEFDKEYSVKLLGPNWRKEVFDCFGKFKAQNMSANKSEEGIKADFAEKVMTGFYEAMDYIFREAFGTESKTTEDMVEGLEGLLFGN